MAKWRGDRKRRALQWYATDNGLALHTDVLVAGPSWRGWPADAAEHRLDALALEGPVGLRSAAEADLDELIAASSFATPILAWGYADRPALGAITTGVAMLARSFPTHGLIRPVALVGAGADRPNTWPAYAARGVQLVAVPEAVLA